MRFAGDTGEVLQRRLTPRSPGRSWPGWVIRPVRVAVTYEAGPTGFALAAAGRRRLAAPSKLIANFAVARELPGWRWAMAVISP